MKAVLLVAGLGTRLRPLTDHIPKCLLPIGGHPLLNIWLDKLEKAGVAEVLVNTHWLHEKVDSFLQKERASRKITVHTFYEPELLGSAGTLAANRDWLCGDSPFFIVYGDNLTWVDLEEMAEFHIQHSLPVTLGVFHSPNPERCGIAEVDNEGTVLSFIEKPKNPKSDLAAAGIYIADKRIFEVMSQSYIDGLDVFDLGFHVFPKLAEKMKIYEIDELIDIGTAQSYKEANKAWQERRGE